MNETAISTTFPRERDDVAFKVTLGNAAAFIGLYVASGFLLGAMCGAIVGTGLLPVLATIYGAIAGAVVGTVAAAPIGLILLVVILIQQASLRTAVYWVDTVAAALATLVVFVLVAKSGLFFVVAGIPAVLSATFAARFAFTSWIAKSQREWIERSDIWPGIRFAHVVLGSVACAGLFAILVQFSITLF